MENLKDIHPALIGGFSLLSLMGLNRFFNGGKNHHFPDLSGKVIVITGANTGLGFIAAQEIAKLNPKVIIFACRSRKRAEDAMNQIKAETPKANV
jgi:NADPH:quinone reductase-like Zn-dependent oxidoreductase